MGIGLPAFLVVSIVVAAVIMFAGMADVVRLGRARFAAVNRRRSDWILLMVLFGPLAVVLYLAAVRPQVVHPDRYRDGEHELSQTSL